MKLYKIIVFKLKTYLNVLSKNILFCFKELKWQLPSFLKEQIIIFKLKFIINLPNIVLHLILVLTLIFFFETLLENFFFFCIEPLLLRTNCLHGFPLHGTCFQQLFHFAVLFLVIGIFFIKWFTPKIFIKILQIQNERNSTQLKLLKNDLSAQIWGYFVGLMFLVLSYYFFKLVLFAMLGDLIVQNEVWQRQKEILTDYDFEKNHVVKWKLTSPLEYLNYCLYKRGPSSYTVSWILNEHVIPTDEYNQIILNFNWPKTCGAVIRSLPNSNLKNCTQEEVEDFHYKAMDLAIYAYRASHIYLPQSNLCEFARRGFFNSD